MRRRLPIGRAVDRRAVSAVAGGGQWQAHAQRIRRLQRLQGIALAVLCVGSLILALAVGRILVASTVDQRVAAGHLRDLSEMRSEMLSTELIVVRASTNDSPINAVELLFRFQKFRTDLRRLERERAGGDGADVANARAGVVRNMAEVDRKTAAYLAKPTEDSVLRSALNALQVPGENMAASLKVWTEKAREHHARIVERGQLLSRRLFWITTLLILALGTLAAAGWFVLERARARLADAIGQSERRFRSLVHNSSDAVMVVDREGVVRYAAPQLHAIVGVAAARIIDRPVTELIGSGTNPLDVEALAEVGTVQWDVVDDTGEVRYLETIVSDRLDDQAIQGVVLNTRDVTDRHVAQVALAYRAYHDTLTDLANRELFEQCVTEAIGESGHPDETLAVILIDLDDFKTVNDSLGHAAGDALLGEVATRLRATLRAEDIAARLGGDEFAILLSGVRDLEEVEALSQRLVDAIRRPMLIEDRELVVQASLGIAMVNGDRTANASSLLRDADVAMYAAKERGRAGFAVFDHSMRSRASDRLGLIADLHRAIERGEISMAYQPVLNLSDDSIAGVEALVRWMHPTRGVIAPDIFVKLAEETGQIQQLGDWVLRTAMREMHEIHAVVPQARDVTLAINVSIRQLERDDFADSVRDAIDACNFPGRRLVFEITETALMRDPATLARQLQLLKDLGATIAVDDFGTGYSSLAYLARLPIDIVKIDRSFVDGIGASARDTRIANMIIGIGASLSLRTVAEGVERHEQRLALEAIGCQMAQGYLFGRPMRAQALQEVLDAQLTARGADLQHLL